MKQVGFAGYVSLRRVTESELPTDSISGRVIEVMPEGLRRAGYASS
jgi:hypothetical protein